MPTPTAPAQSSEKPALICRVCRFGPAPAPEGPWDGACIGGADCDPIPNPSLDDTEPAPALTREDADDIRADRAHDDLVQGVAS
jgi:hypothetical protein